jgi:hypothetical protein
MPKFLLPTPLRPYAGGAATVDVSGRTVAGALASLVGRHEGLRAFTTRRGGSPVHQHLDKE